MTKEKGRHVDESASVEQDEQALIRGIQKDYEFAIKANQQYFDIMIDLALEHDNNIDEDELPTRSKASTAYKFAQVEEQLSFAFPYLWPEFNPVRVMPRTEENAMEAARKVERGVYSMAKYDMAGPETTLPTIRDCAKVGIGYSIIEPYSYAPLDVYDMSIQDEAGNVTEKTREIDIGETIDSLRNRYISPGQINPYPDGHCPNGPGRASTVFFWDFMTEFEFRNLVSKDKLEGLDFDVAKLDDKAIEDIVNKAKNPNFTFVGKTFDNIKQLGGIDYMGLASAERSAQATIPILKVYAEAEHVWLANGTTIIYRQANRAQTHRCPILRMSAVRDGMNWFPFSTAEAMRGENYQKNVWKNLVTDLMVWAARRPLVYNDDAFDGKAPQYGPDSSIKTTGTDDVRKAAMFLAAPGIGSDTLAVGDMLDRVSTQISGQKDLTQKNFSRGGQHAFNDLINSAEGRQRIAGAVMQTGFMKDFYAQVMIYMQIEMRGYRKIGREIDEDTGEEKTTSIVVTREDLAHAYELSVSYDAQKYATEFSITERLQLVDSKVMNDGTWDPYEKKRFLLGSDELLHRMSLNKKKTQEISEQNRQDERAAMLQQGQAPAQQGAWAAPAEAGAELGGAPAGPQAAAPQEMPAL
jgi:hypothetical protein